MERVKHAMEAALRQHTEAAGDSSG
jgi:hypothetical protein